jgi:hypothetical protein
MHDALRSRPHGMSQRLTPEDGDIVIQEHSSEEGTVVYILHTAPGPDQYVLRSRHDAVAQAVAVAKRQAVRAWLADDGCDFQLLEDFRIAESV